MSDVTCSICGFHFDPASHRSCSACPLQSGCSLSRCPNCGCEIVDPNQSFLARAAARLFHLHPQEKQNMQVDQILCNLENHAPPSIDIISPKRYRLTELPSGAHARMVEFAPEIPVDQKTKLQAYGLTPGNALSLCQHRPVTIIQVEHTELAFEENLAEAIIVEKM